MQRFTFGGRRDSRAQTSRDDIKSDSERHESDMRQVRDDRSVQDDTRRQDSQQRDNSVPDVGRDHAVVDEATQRDQFGGMKLGSAFFGWLVSAGLSTILLSLLAAAGAAVALTQTRGATGTVLNEIETVGVVSGILFAVVMGVAYYAGGYVAGRMARFNGARQGAGVWAFGILATLALAVAAALFGANYNILAQLNLPNLPVNGDAFTTGGLITSLATLLVTLAAAMLGGKAGTRFHRKVDAAGTVERTWLGNHFGSRHGGHAHSH